MNFHVYTDGSCKGNPGKGGYAYTVYDDFGDVWIKSSGSEQETTNNKMELTAAIESLRMIDKTYPTTTAPHVIIIYSDSAYLVNCFKDNWIGNWMKNGWLNYDKQPILNKEMWEILYELVVKTGTVFEKVSRKDKRIQEVDREAKLAARNLG